MFLEREVESVGSSCAEMEGVTAAPRSLPDHFDESKNRGSPVRRTDSPSKKKGVVVMFSSQTEIYLCHIAAMIS